jgi:nicotinate-nucleotide pyrophosphorylase (carboxylating)
VDEYSDGLQFAVQVEDGQPVAAGDVVATLTGQARQLLRIERTCLNFLGRLSGICSLTAQYVASVAGTRAQVLDTRKTTPGWRRLEKYAVRCGGGTNHRLGLFDAVLIKDNHLAFCRNDLANPVDAAGAIERMRAWLRSRPDGRTAVAPAIEIEVDSLEQLRRAAAARPDVVLLDNMSPDELRSCVRFRDEHAPGILLEASGGVNLYTISDVAATGVDRISVGALTHSAVNFDIGLDWSPQRAGGRE